MSDITIQAKDNGPFIVKEKLLSPTVADNLLKPKAI